MVERAPKPELIMPACADCPVEAAYAAVAMQFDLRDMIQEAYLPNEQTFKYDLSSDNQRMFELLIEDRKHGLTSPSSKLCINGSQCDRPTKGIVFKNNVLGIGLGMICHGKLSVTRIIHQQETTS